MTLCRGRAVNPKTEKFLPKMRFLTKPGHHAKRGFCVFADEFRTRSEHHFHQVETTTPISNQLFKPWWAPPAHSPAVPSAGAVQTFISLIVQGTEQPTLICAQHSTQAAQGFILLFLGNKILEFPTGLLQSSHSHLQGKSHLQAIRGF